MIKATELLLNALNQGDYDTYTRLCDPHMTSFEPENLGHLIDNMEYRRFCLDQARQLQFAHNHQQQLLAHNQAAQVQSAAAAAATAAVSATLAANAQASGAGQPPATPTKHGGAGGPMQASQLQQVASAAAIAAVNAALANLNLGQAAAPQQAPASASTSTTNSITSSTTSTGSQPAPTNATSQTISQQPFITGPLAIASNNNRASLVRQYSLMLNPSVHLMGEEAATIAYTKLSQIVDLLTGQLVVEQSEETRVWHKRDSSSSANKWLCIHLHRSIVNNSNSSPSLFGGSAYGQTAFGGSCCGPQTSVSLIRSMANQQQLFNLALMHQQQQRQKQQQQHTTVPLISLNHSSTGTSNAGQQSSSQSTNSSR